MNIALPLATSPLIKSVTFSHARISIFLIAVIVIFTLNQYIGLSRRWLWPLQTCNILSAMLVGALTVFMALPALPGLLRALAAS
ncbi:hypothetical protein [uncultured Roseobacter sp.]|uniref:hypothetical protein n=1 Tax=uncultured Roseobacter sp. TaxID=114847 RepID=UPI0026234BC8|nr:hypothetical protein [uncultured Roseobacter sp.]